MAWGGHMGGNGINLSITRERSQCPFSIPRQHSAQASAKTCSAVNHACQQSICCRNTGLHVSSTIVQCTHTNHAARRLRLLPLSSSSPSGSVSLFPGLLAFCCTDAFLREAGRGVILPACSRSRTACAFSAERLFRIWALSLRRNLQHKQAAG